MLQNNYSSNLKDHWSQITVTNKIVKSLKYCDSYLKCDTKTWNYKHFWEMTPVDLLKCSVATNLQFVKNTVTMESSTVAAIKWGMSVMLIFSYMLSIF